MTKEHDHRELYDAFHSWFMGTTVDFWSECDAPEYLAQIAVEIMDAKIAAAERRGWGRAIEAAAQWHDERGVAPSGPEYGMSTEDERRAMRIHARFHCECAFAIRALEPPK
jgi:hypothetical protein